MLNPLEVGKENFLQSENFLFLNEALHFSCL